MMSALGRAMAAAIFGALVGAAAAALLYAWHPAFVIEFDRDFPRNVSGIYGPERDAATGTTFAWTGDDAVVRLPGLDRRVDWTLQVRVRGGRPGGDANPSLTVLADGVTLATQPTGSEFADLTVVVPKRPDRRGLTLGLRSSSAFVPPGDPRRLGVMLDRLSILPSGVVLVPRPALGAAGLSSAAMGATIALLGVTPASALGAAVLIGAGDAAVVTRGFAPFTDYPSVVTRLGWSIALVVTALSMLLQYRRGRPLRNTARFAAAFSAAALFLKLAVLLHPNMGTGDTMFHAHKLQGVLAGNLYFTSIAPGGYTFPYPPGLYIFASAFAGLVRRGAGDMALLRIICTAADAAVGLLLYTLVVRNWGQRLTGAMAVAIFQLIPLSFAVLTTGNMSNAFAQSAATAALVVMAWPFGSARSGPLDSARGRPSATRAWLPGAVLLCATLLVGFLSHTGTLATLFVSAVLIAALFIVRGDAGLRRAGTTILITTMIAAAIAVVVYYAHFMTTYRTEFARIGHETATAARDAGGRTIADRLRSVPYSLDRYLGAPVMLFALLGGLEIAMRRTADRLALALGGWMLACGVFLVLGIVTPVDMRYYLAAIPGVAVAAASGAAWAWSDRPAHRRLWRAAAVIFLAWTVWAGIHAWWIVLG